MYLTVFCVKHAHRPNLQARPNIIVCPQTFFKGATVLLQSKMYLNELKHINYLGYALIYSISNIGYIFDRYNWFLITLLYSVKLATGQGHGYIQLL